jgi:hypothetical protein
LSEPQSAPTPAATTETSSPAADGIPEGIDALDSVEDRAAAFIESLGPSAMVPAYSSNDEPQAAAKPKEAAEPAPAATAADPPPAPTGPSRAEKFAKLRAEEAAKLERSRYQRDNEQRAAEMERHTRAIEEERKMIEPLLRIIKSKDVMALNEFVSEHFAPDEVASAIGAWGSDETREKWRVKNIKEEAKSEVQKELADMRRMLEEAVIVPQQKQQEKQRQEQVYSAFADTVKKHAEDSPFCSRLLSSKPEALFALADATANSLPKGWTFYDVIDHIERTYAPEPAATIPTTAPTSKGQSAQTNAAAKATTVTNRHAADRTTVIEGDELEEGMSIDERAERLKQSWNGSQLKSNRQ